MNKNDKKYLFIISLITLGLATIGCWIAGQYIASLVTFGSAIFLLTNFDHK